MRAVSGNCSVVIAARLPLRAFLTPVRFYIRWVVSGLIAVARPTQRHFAQALHFSPLAGLKGLVECTFPKSPDRPAAWSEPWLLSLPFCAPAVAT